MKSPSVSEKVNIEPAITPDACAAGGYREAMRRHLVPHAGQWCAFEPLPEALA